MKPTDLLSEENLHKFVDMAFVYHPPTDKQIFRYTVLRKAAKDFGHLIVNLTPVSVEQAQALLHLQQTIMFANAAIAINEAEEDSGA